MANDRLFLRCPRCGMQFMLAKHFAQAWSSVFDTADLDKFFDDHFVCSPQYVGERHSFELCTESGPMAPKVGE